MNVFSLGGQNPQQQQQQASTNQVPGNPMMITSNISQTGQLKFNEPNGNYGHVCCLTFQMSLFNFNFRYQFQCLEQIHIIFQR